MKYFLLLSLLLFTGCHELQYDDLAKGRGIPGRVVGIDSQNKTITLLTMGGEKEFPAYQVRYCGPAGSTPSGFWDGDTGIPDLIFVLVLWLFVSPIGWGVLILIILGFTRGSIAYFFQQLRKDRTKISEPVKRNVLLNELEKD